MFWLIRLRKNGYSSSEDGDDFECGIRYRQVSTFLGTKTMLINCATIRLAFLVAIHSTLAQCAEPRLKMRVPDDSILQLTEHQVPVKRDPIDLFEPPPLNPVDSQSLFSELPLSGPRGQESPAGNRYGRYCQNSFVRSGYPFCIGFFAQPSTDRYHQVSYVGGGTLFGGSSRKTTEGTFGMDYSGHWFSRKTWLKWSHGARYQGGQGRYETEGPRLLPE